MENTSLDFIVEIINQEILNLFQWVHHDSSQESFNINDFVITKSLNENYKVRALPNDIKKIYQRLDELEIDYTETDLLEKDIINYNIDISKDFKGLDYLIKKIKPDTIVHFAEQRSAPYSMKSIESRNYTITNNLITNNNVLYSIAKNNKKIHLIHLGTMGVYGYDFSKYLIPEGYYKAKLFIKSNVINTKILHPASPGSIYHLTKAQDELLFQF